MIPLARAIGISFGAGGNWASYWSKQTDIFLFFGQIENISAGELPNEMTGSSDALTVTGAAGSYTFQCPDTAPYIAADTDYIWFKTDETQRTPTEAELVGYDFPRTPVKYDDDDPYSIRWIAILKTGVTLTADQLNDLHQSFYLHTLWTGVINGYGHIKGNKLDQTLWTPEAVYTFFDSFTGADTTDLTAHTPDSANFAWLYSTGHTVISGNKAYPTTSDAYCFSYFNSSDLTPDISVKLTVPDANAYFGGLLIRYKDSDEHWKVNIYRTAGGTPLIRIQKYQTVVASAEVAHVAGDGILRCVVVGDNFTVYWKGIKVIDNYTTDGSFNTYAIHGIYLYRAAAFAAVYADDFTII